MEKFTLRDITEEELLTDEEAERLIKELEGTTKPLVIQNKDNPDAIWFTVGDGVWRMEEEDDSLAGWFFKKEPDAWTSDGLFKLWYGLKANYAEEKEDEEFREEQRIEREIAASEEYYRELDRWVDRNK